MSFVRDLAKASIARIGYRTNLPIIVFESDDWGSVRLPSRQALRQYKERYPEHELNHYQSYDGLESAEDICLLGEVLASHKLANGYPIFTLNFATANPCFSERQILFDGAGEFTYEQIKDTYSRYFTGPSVLDLIVGEPFGALFHPQLHSREHLNVTQWREGIGRHEHLRYAYDLEILGLDPRPYCAMDSLNLSNTLIDRREYLIEAAFLFESYFGFASTSFIPPCYVITKEDRVTLRSLGVTTLQGGWCNNHPRNDGKLRKIPGRFGRISQSKQVQLVRNCKFEPSSYRHIGKSEDACVGDALSDLERAFKLGQPAVFCTHRVNYTSLIDVGNRAYSLRCLDMLLRRITDEHPDVIFTTSDKLGEHIAQSYEHAKRGDSALLALETLL